MPRFNATSRKAGARISYLGLVGCLMTLLLAPAASAEEPLRCGTVWYEWVGDATAVVKDYVEDPGLSITIVGTYLWAQNTAEPASSTQHTTSVKLTADSPNPYTICVGDTTEAPTEEPNRCGIMWYAWVGTTPVVKDYVEDPGLSITIVGTYLWAQNTAEPASSTEHKRSVELTADSPNPYTICIGDTTDPVSEPAATAAQAKATVTPEAVAQPAKLVVETLQVVDPSGTVWASVARWDPCEKQPEALLCAL